MMTHDEELEMDINLTVEIVEEEGVSLGCRVSERKKEKARWE